MHLQKPITFSYLPAFSKTFAAFFLICLVSPTFLFAENVNQVKLIEKITKTYGLDPENSSEDQCKMMDILYSITHEEDNSLLLQDLRKKLDASNFNVVRKSSNLDLINDEIFVRYFNTYYKNVLVDSVAIIFDSKQVPLGYFSALMDSFGYSKEDLNRKYFFTQRKSKVDLDNFLKQSKQTNLAISGCYVVFTNHLKINQ